ncbi:MAG TPA: CinA family protein [Segetibacter sp.]|nr:CinA family protein [Segetibacter sp.]
MIYNEEIINSIKDILISRQETISAAESVTAGHLQAAFSTGIDASQYFQGGITAYNIGQKARHLNVDPILCGRVNCVSPQIADTMALQVSKMFTSHYGIGITGYASIVPECEEDGLFAYFSLSHKGEIVMAERIRSSEKHPHDVQVDYTSQVTLKILEHLKQSS